MGARNDPLGPLRLAFIGNPRSVHVQRWITFFAARGHDVSLLDGFEQEVPPELDERIRVERYDVASGMALPFGRALRARRSLRRLLDRLRPDALHAHSAAHYGWQAALAGYHPYVVSVWGSDLLLKSARNWRGRIRTWITLRGADVVTAVSEYMRMAAIEAGARPERIEIVQHGVDVSRYSPSRVSPDRLDGLGLGEAPFIFSPRAIRPLYRHETVIDAFAQLPRDLRLVMSARGADPSYLERIRRRAAERGVADQLRIMDDISEDNMVELDRAARVVVSVPESDSFPVTLLEAMACEKPVVASDLPPVRAVLEELAPDSLVPVGDAAALAAALRRSLELPEYQRERIGERLRAYVVAVADYEPNMLRMEEIYRRLAGRGATA